MHVVIWFYTHSMSNICCPFIHRQTHMHSHVTCSFTLWTWQQSYLVLMAAACSASAARLHIHQTNNVICTAALDQQQRAFLLGISVVRFLFSTLKKVMWVIFVLHLCVCVCVWVCVCVCLCHGCMFSGLKLNNMLWRTWWMSCYLNEMVVHHLFFKSTNTVYMWIIVWQNN